MHNRDTSHRFITTAGLLAAICITGCQSGYAPSSPDELRNAIMSDYHARFDGEAERIRLETPPSEFEASLERVLRQAADQGQTPPEGRRTVQENIDAADEDSGAQAYTDEVPVYGRDLVDAEEAQTVTIDLRSAVHRALEHNTDLEVARFNPRISEQQIIQAQAVFDTVVFASSEWAELDTPRPPGAIPGLSGDQQSSSRLLTTGIRRAFSTGAQVSVQASVERSQQNPSFFGVNRYYDSDVLVQISQPLLQGFGSDVNEANIQLTTIARDAELAQVRSTMIDLTVAIEQTYWQLVAARQVLQIQQRLHARTIEMRDKLEPRVGFDILQSDLNEVNARVDQRYADIIRARQNVRTLSDQLKRLMNDPDIPVIDETIIEPAETPADDAIAFSLLDQVTTALQNRPEMENALLQIDDAEVRRIVADNLQLPILNLTASTTFNGLDVNDPGDALGNTTDLDYIDWAIGFEFERPWGNRDARSVFEQRTLERQRAMANYRLQAQVVTLDVKDTLRTVASNYQLISISRSQRRASALSLEVADVQLERGGRNENDNYTTRIDRVLARQEALAQAEFAEVQALRDYMIALSELHRATGTTLQQAGVEVESEEID